MRVLPSLNCHPIREPFFLDRLAPFRVFAAQYPHHGASWHPHTPFCAVFCFTLSRRVIGLNSESAWERGRLCPLWRWDHSGNPRRTGRFTGCRPDVRLAAPGTIAFVKLTELCLRYDYVVVGGGTAGNAIGVRLAEAGFSVAIVEAGIFYEIAKPVLGTTPAGAFFGAGASLIDSLPTVDWEFKTEPQAGCNNRKVHYARGKCLGGSSALNFMIHHRASEGSYEQWADMVGDDSYR